MDVAEFDQFADEYHNLHQENILITGEKPEYFAEYKICDLKRVAKIVGVDVKNILDFGTGVGTISHSWPNIFQEPVFLELMCQRNL